MKKGWNTWSSSLPKEYLVEFLISAGADQEIYIDDILPRYYKRRSLESQARMTDLYTLFLDDFYKHIYPEYNRNIHYLSASFDILSFLKATSDLKISDLLRSMPKEKRINHAENDFVELLHTASENYLFRDMLTNCGVRKILKGSGQLGLVNEQSISDEIEVLPKGDTSKFLEHCGQSLHHINEVKERLNYWKAAKLLKGYSSVDTYHQYLKTTTNTLYTLDSIYDFYRDCEVSIMFCGSQANKVFVEGADIDLVCFSDTLNVPQSIFSNPSIQVREAYSQNTIQEISLKAIVRGVKVSLRFIKPDLIWNYFSNTIIEYNYWRTTSLKLQGDEYLDFYRINNEAISLKMDELCFENGFIYKMSSREGKDILITPIIHMVLTGRLVIDNLCMSLIKYRLVRQITNNYSKITENDLFGALGSFIIAKDIREELSAIIDLQR